MKKYKKLGIIILIGFIVFFSTKVEAASNKVVKNCIDYPTKNQEVGDMLTIQGWFMSKEDETELEIYLDDELLEDISRYSRGDVLKKVTDYGTEVENPTPGYTKRVELEDLSYGTHKVTIRILKGEEELYKEEQSFIHTSPKTLINIDYPTKNQPLTEQLKIQGWVMTTAKDTKVQVIVDTEEIEEIKRQTRPDVLKAINGYGDSSTNPTPGFSATFDISNFSYGKHQITINILDEKDEILKTETRTFEHAAPKTWINLDAPKEITEAVDTLKIQGWMMSTASNTKIKIYLDEEEVEGINRQKREDVLKAIKDYGTALENPTPGFSTTVNIQNKSYGKHTIKIEVLDEKEDKIQTLTRTFEIKSPKSIIDIDYPTTTVNGTRILIQGWYLSNASNTKLEIYVDNDKIETYQASEREDVYKIYKNTYGTDTTLPGYSASYDGSALKDGKHVVTIRILSSQNTLIMTKTKSFTLTKVKGKLNIDYLEQSHKKIAYYLNGWEMSTEDNSHLKVWIDNKEASMIENRSIRKDVIKTITGYGNESVNQAPGITGYIDISKLSLGDHKVKIALYSKYEEELDSLTKNIRIITKDYEVTEEGEVSQLNYDVVYYNQYDARWANVMYGVSKFGPRGCAPTSMAMAFTGILGRTILPTDVANYLYNRTNEFNKTTKGTSGLGIIYATDYYHIKRTGINSLEDLNKELKQGKLVFAAMGNGTYGTAFWNHAIILKEYEEGKTYSYDPLNTNNNKWISTSTVWKEKSVDRDDYRGGSIFYALESYN